MSHRTRHWAVVLAVSLPLLLTAHRAPADFPKGDDLARTPTRHDYARELLAHQRQTLPDAYKASGRKNPKWDDAAVKALDALAHHFTNAAVGVMYQVDGAPSNPELLKLSQAAVDAGCDDPLVLYCHAVALSDNRRTAEAPPLFKKAYNAMAAEPDKYPPLRVMVAATRQRSADIDRAALETFIVEQMKRAVVGPFLNGAHRRVVYERIQEDLAIRPSEARQQVIDALAAHQGADPWITSVLLGDRFIDTAWEARGGGWANQVGEDAWKTFFDRLRTAEQHLTKAWRLEPKLPEAPSLMITVCMGASNQKELLWFERAIEAQLDHEDAFNRIYTALLPRWGGTYEDMLEIGIEAARTARYDTVTPFQLIAAIERITADKQRPGGKWDVWAHPEAYKLVTDVFTNYAKQLKSEQGADWYRSYHAAVAWRVGKLDDARRILDEVGDKVQPALFSRVGTTGLAISHTYGMTGPHAKDIKAAIDMYNSAKLEDVHKAFADLVRKIDRNDKAHAYVRDRFVSLDHRVRFEAGQEIDILPAADYSAWRAQAGYWNLDKPEDDKSDKKTALIGTSVEAGALIVLDAPLPTNRYQITAKVEMTDANAGAAGPRRRPPAAGLAFGCTDAAPQHNALMVIAGRPSQGMLLVAGGPGAAIVKVPDNKPYELRVTCFDGKLAGSINGTPFGPADNLLPPLNVDPKIGLVIHPASGPGHTLRVTELKLRKLDKDPNADN